MSEQNPVGLMGIEFVEYAGRDPKQFETLFEKFGFRKFADKKNQKIQLYRQGDINFLINAEPGSFAEEFQNAHGPSICAMAFRVKNSKQAYETAIQRGARPYKGNKKLSCDFPVLYGIGDSLIYLVDTYGSQNNIYENSYNFVTSDRTHEGFGFKLVDHLTNNVPVGKMQEWCEFYEKIFGFKERRFFDIKGKKTGLISKVMASADGKVCIPINEPTDSKSQIQEYLDEYKGPGIQHLALLTNDICKSISDVREKGIGFLDAPDTYFEMIPTRVPNVTEKIARLKDLRILVDGDEKGYLLQIFSQNLIGPIFFEVIQRKGHDGFGDGNFQALFDAIERDQMRRGVL